MMVKLFFYLLLEILANRSQIQKKNIKDFFIGKVVVPPVPLGE
jgi:hypothetical protein